MNSSNRWLRIVQPNPTAQLRLFCFPYAGGAASIYRTWPQLLPATIEVCAVQLPGRENRINEPAFSDLGELVQTLLTHLQPVLDKPFAFFGHSMGTLIAYEVAQQLRRQNRQLPTYLLLSGCRAPQLPKSEPLLHTLPNDEPFLAELQRRYQNLPQILFEDVEFRQLFMPLLRADFQLVETYTDQTTTPLPCPIVAFGGADDNHATLTELRAWQALTLGSFALHLFPGDHFYFSQQPQPLVQTIGQILSG